LFLGRWPTGIKRHYIVKNYLCNQCLNRVFGKCIHWFVSGHLFRHHSENIHTTVIWDNCWTDIFFWWLIKLVSISENCNYYNRAGIIFVLWWSWAHRFFIISSCTWVWAPTFSSGIQCPPAGPRVPLQGPNAPYNTPSNFFELWNWFSFFFKTFLHYLLWLRIFLGLRIILEHIISGLIIFWGLKIVWRFPLESREFLGMFPRI